MPTAWIVCDAEGLVLATSVWARDDAPTHCPLVIPPGGRAICCDATLGRAVADAQLAWSAAPETGPRPTLALVPEEAGIAVLDNPHPTEPFRPGPHRTLAEQAAHSEPPLRLTHGLSWARNTVPRPEAPL